MPVSTPVSSMIDTLTVIWRRLFEQPSIGIHENFFELGGNPSLAVRLFDEITHACGWELPPMMIYQAPTIAELAVLLEQPRGQRLSPLVLLKPGAKKPPAFLVHGIGGSVMEFFDLVRHLSLPHPVYGLQAQEIDDAGRPLESIEDMARVFLEAIRRVQPTGPYFFIGYSLGGLVTLEMAQRLLSSGEKIGLLTMVDSYPHASRLSWEQRVRLLLCRTGRRAAILLPFLGRRRHLRGTGLYKPPQAAAFAPSMQRTRDNAYTALKRYQPRFYEGRITFVRAESPTSFPDNPIPVWARLAADFEVETVPGDHLGMLTVHYEQLASVLNCHLRGALYGIK
ncbi:MAG: alpha/beta fold hydrolase [Bryobacterales bacterium]|nr:alpha/beta fold hydrolase [Bryobacterales bacterium]